MSEKIPEKLTEEHHAALDTREAETLVTCAVREPFERRVRAVWLADLGVWLAECVDGDPFDDTTRLVCETREEVLQIARNAYELWAQLDADDLDADDLEWLAPEPSPEPLLLPLAKSDGAIEVAEETELPWADEEHIREDIEGNSVSTVYVDEEYYAEFASDFRVAYERNFGPWRTEYWLNLRDDFEDRWVERIEDEIRSVLLGRRLRSIYG